MEMEIAEELSGGIDFGPMKDPRMIKESWKIL